MISRQMNPQVQNGFKFPLWLKIAIALSLIAVVVFGTMWILNEGKTGVGVKSIKTEEQVSDSLTEVSTNVDDIKARLEDIDKGLG